MFFKIKAMYCLGLFNVLNVILYKIRIKLMRYGFVERGKENTVTSKLYFRQIVGVKFQTNIRQPCPYNWYENVFNGKFSFDYSPWYKICDFNNELGDIKGIWKASRFDWLLTLAKAAITSKPDSIDSINSWLDNWVINNPYNIGPNWKCGQEASIRVMHLAFSAKLLNQVRKTEPTLLALIKAHLQRIAPTISYAVAQDNNHGTSEAAALFIGGSWMIT